MYLTLSHMSHYPTLSYTISYTTFFIEFLTIGNCQDTKKFLMIYFVEYTTGNVEFPYEIFDRFLESGNFSMPPVSEGEKQAIADWRKKDKRAKKEICLRISDEYLVYIDQTMTVSELWTRLQSIFKSKAAVGVVNLHQEFFRTFTEDGANMEKHVHKLRGLYQQLNAQGQVISDADFLNTMLTSLPDSWSAFITTINAGGAGIASEILIDWIRIRLDLDEDKSRRASTAQQTALKANDESGATKGKCRNCGKKGHYVKDCWVKGGGKEGQTPTWYKDRTGKDTAKQSDETDFAFMANEVALASISSSDWLADSAATMHIARNKCDFTTYKEESSEIEGIMPGASLRTQGCGKVTVEFKVNSKTYSVNLQDIKRRALFT